MTRLLILGLALGTQLSLAAETAVIAQWNFNSATPDGTSSTGTLVPNRGSGTATLLGGASGTFAAGATGKGQDPAGTEDNTAWNTSSYPGSGSNELTAGVSFTVDTTGFETLSLSWWQRHSGTASRYVRVQYTTDGVSYQDAATVAVLKDSVFTNITVDLAFDPGAANNPAFAFRLLTLFESTALGWGAGDFVATEDGANYSRAGTIRYDLVTVTGTRIAGANTPPTVSVLRDQTMRVGQTSAVLFAIGDAEDLPSNLAVLASSTDWRVVPQGQLRVEGSGTERYLYVTAGETPGTSEVTLTVSDTGGRSASSRFQVQVLPVNTAPWIAGPTRTNVLVSGEVLVPFTVGDLESPLDSLDIEVTSGNNALVPQGSLLLGGASSNRFVRVRSGASGGIVSLRIWVRDAGGLQAETSFGVAVRSSTEAVLAEQFQYGDGPLVTSSAYWLNRSGTEGQCLVVGGTLHLDSELTEDVVARLPDAPYTMTNTPAIYASFTLKADQLGRANGGLIAHFVEGVNLRGRVHVITTNSPQGHFRLAVANGAATPVDYPLELTVGQMVRVVTRYELASCWTRLWLNPQSEEDLFVESYDEQKPVKVSGYGFRQDDDLGGTFRVDDLRVGLTFNSLMEQSPQHDLRLSGRREGGELVLTWDDPLSVLQSSPAPGEPFDDVAGARSPWRVVTIFGQEFFRLR